MKEQNQRQIQNQTELDERRLRQKKLVRKRKIVLSVMLLTSFLLGCVCGRYFPEIKLGKTEEVLASAQDNSGEEKKENQITNNVDNGTTADGTEKEEQSATETVEEPADSEETNDPFAEIPQVVLSKPVDYSLNQAIRQLEQMEASDERYAQIVENAEKYPEKLLINLANNPEMIAFVADYKGNTRDYDKAELTEKELQEEYPLFLQWDKRWGCLAYGDDRREFLPIPFSHLPTVQDKNGDNNSWCPALTEAQAGTPFFSEISSPFPDAVSVFPATVNTAGN